MADLFSDHIPLLRPWIDDGEINAVAEAMRSGWVTLGPKVAEFENAIANYVGTRYAVATNSCTTSLHLVLRFLGVGNGDDVIIPSFTCMATANAVHMAGAQPVFADIDARTYNLDVQSVEEAITPKTKAIILVHQIGLPADVDAFAELARRRGVALIEDGACTLGGTYKGKKVGGLGNPTCFSFHPRKMITTGEGGMITTDDERLVEQARCLRSAGASSSDLERHKAKGTLIQQYFDFGYNYRFTDMQAAMGLVQFAKLPEIITQRSEQARRYDTAFAGIEGLETPYVPKETTHAWSSYMVRLKRDSGLDRDEVLRALADKGVSCRIGIQPLHFEPLYREKWSKLSLPQTEQAARETLFLPIFPGLQPAEQERVVAALSSVLADIRRSVRAGATAK